MTIETRPTTGAPSSDDLAVEAAARLAHHLDELGQRMAAAARETGAVRTELRGAVVTGEWPEQT